MAWADDELELLADAHFRGERVLCPRDRSTVGVEEIKVLGKRTADLFLICRRCNESGVFRNVPESDGELVWPEEQRREIVDEYWAAGRVRCPGDGTRLTIREIRTIGRTGETPISVHCWRCGRNFFSDETTKAEKGDTFETRFEVVRTLGRGGMGTVDLVRDRQTGAEYAAKRVRSDLTSDPEYAQRLRREIRLLKELSHPNVVRIEADFGESDRAVYVMEYLPGGTLVGVIRNRSVEPHRLADLFDQVAAGVTAIHERGLVHRDLKPANVLLTADGIAKVSDLGLAVRLARDTTPLTSSGEGFGTEQYMAPEQRRGARDVNEKADVYSLGVMAAEVVARECPCGHDTITSLTQGPDRFARTLVLALKPNPAERTVTPQGIAAAVRERLIQEELPTLPRSGPTEIPQGEQTKLGEVPMVGDVDAYLAALGFRRTGDRGWPEKGRLYLGRGYPPNGPRGIYRREVPQPAGGRSAADVFEFLEQVPPA